MVGGLSASSIPDTMGTICYTEVDPEIPKERGTSTREQDIFLRYCILESKIKEYFCVV